MDIEKTEEAVGEAVGIVNIKKRTEKIEEEPAQRLKTDEVAEKEPIRKDTTEVEKEFMVETDAYPTVDRIMNKILKHLEGISVLRKSEELQPPRIQFLRINQERQLQKEKLKSLNPKEESTKGRKTGIILKNLTNQNMILQRMKTQLKEEEPRRIISSREI